MESITEMEGEGVRHRCFKFFAVMRVLEQNPEGARDPSRIAVARWGAICRGRAAPDINAAALLGRTRPMIGVDSVGNRGVSKLAAASAAAVKGVGDRLGAHVVSDGPAGQAPIVAVDDGHRVRVRPLASGDGQPLGVGGWTVVTDQVARVWVSGGGRVGLA